MAVKKALDKRLAEEAEKARLQAEKEAEEARIRAA